MQRTQRHGRSTTGAVLLLATAFAALSAAPTAAQSTQQAAAATRMQVLVPRIPISGQGSKNFGKDVAGQLRKLIDQLPTHEALDAKDLKNDLKKYGVKENDLDNCITTRQLGVQLNINLVVCGSYQETAKDQYQMQAQFIAPKSGESFDIAPFPTTDADEAAQHIFDAFHQYLTQITRAKYCDDYSQSQQWANALDNCNQALAVNPKSASVQYLRAHVLMEMDSLPQAYAGFQKVLEIDPINQDAMLSAGIVAAQLSKEAESLKYLKQYMELNPSNESVRLSVAQKAAQAGNPEAALQITEEGMKGDSVSATLLEYAGHFAVASAVKIDDTGKDPRAQPFLEKALQYYNQALQKEGSKLDPFVIRQMLTADRMLGHTDEAIQLGAQAVQQHPDDAGIWSAYADNLHDAGQVDQALAALDRAEAADPDAKVYARRGLWLVEQGKIDDGVAAIRKAEQRSEIDASKVDQLAQQIAVTGYDQKGKQKQYDAAYKYYDAAESLAQSPASKGLIAYLHGVNLYQATEAVAKNDQSLKAARATLPKFRQVLQYMSQAQAYTHGNPSAEKTRITVINAANQYISIDEALIKRGK